MVATSLPAHERQVVGGSENEEQRKYRRNAYRVLLTRARQGIVLYIPLAALHLILRAFRLSSMRLPRFFSRAAPGLPDRRQRAPTRNPQH